MHTYTGPVAAPMVAAKAASRPALCCLPGADAGRGRDCHEEDPRMRPTFHIRSWRPRLGRGVAVLTAAVLGCAGLAAVAAVRETCIPGKADRLAAHGGTGFAADHRPGLGRGAGTGCRADRGHG